MNVTSKNLSIMMTDIQGYTDTTSASSRAQLVELLRNHNRLMIPVIRFYGGTIIKSIGDALLVTFNSATDAVVCGIIIQLLLGEYNSRQKDDGKKMKLRVVVNSGDVTLENNDVFGDAVNITARMEGLACFPGGTIGISESTYLMLNRNEIVADRIGPQEMKGIPFPVTVYSIPLEKQKLTQVPTKLLELVERVINHPKELGAELDGMVQEILTHAALSPGETSPGSPPPSKEIPDAPLGIRFKAFFLDFVVIILSLIILKVAKGGGFIFFYFALLWYFRNATIGQMVFNLKVVAREGKPPGLFQCLLRSLFLLPSIIFFFLMFMGKGRPLLDLIANTRVIMHTGESG